MAESKVFGCLFWTVMKKIFCSLIILCWKKMKWHFQLILWYHCSKSCILYTLSKWSQTDGLRLTVHYLYLSEIFFYHKSFLHQLKFWIYNHYLLHNFHQSLKILKFLILIKSKLKSTIQLLILMKMYLLVQLKDLVSLLWLCLLCQILWMRVKKLY